MTEPTKLVTTKPDAEIAEALKADLLAAYKPIMDILERARAQGFICNVQVGATSPHAPIGISALQIMKQF